MRDLDFIDDLLPKGTNPNIEEATKEDWEDFWNNEDEEK